MRWVFSIVLLCVSTNISFAAESFLDIYALAIAADPELKQVQLAYDIALEEKQQGMSLLLPNVSISGNSNKDKQKRSYEVSLFDGEESYSSYGYSLSIKQSLFNYNNIMSFRQAYDRINQVNTELRATEQSLIIKLLECYFDVLSAENNLRFVEAEKQAVERQLAQAETRLSAGLAAITDVFEARAQLDATIAQLFEAQNQLENSLEALREITNNHHDKLEPLVPSLHLVKPALFDINDWVDVAIKSNFTIAGLQHNSNLLRKEINRLRSGHLPTLDLVATYSKTISGGGNFGQSNIESSSIGLQFNMPIYQGGVVSSQVKTAVIQYQQNMEKLEAETRSVRMQVRKAYLGVLASISRVNSLERSVESSDKALHAIEAGNRVGMRTMVDILQANRKLHRVQRDYERARYDYVLNGFRLKQLAGSLSMEDLLRKKLWGKQ